MNQTELNETQSIDIINQPDLVSKIFSLSKTTSITAAISHFQPMITSTTQITSIDYDKAQNKLLHKSKLIDAESEWIDSTYTEEAIQDLYTIYNEDINTILSEYFNKEITKTIDAKTLALLSANATVGNTITFNTSDFKDFGTVSTNIIMKMSFELTNMAAALHRPAKAFAILSPKIATLITFAQTYRQKEYDLNHTYIGTLGSVDCYIDYTATDPVDTITLGMREYGNQLGSLIYAPYNNTFQYSLSKSTGERTLHMLNRTGIALSPFDSATGNNDSDYLVKFGVDLSSYDI